MTPRRAAGRARLDTYATPPPAPRSDSWTLGEGSGTTVGDRVDQICQLAGPAA